MRNLGFKTRNGDGRREKVRFVSGSGGRRLMDTLGIPRGDISDGSVHVKTVAVDELIL